MIVVPMPISKSQLNTYLFAGKTALVSKSQLNTYRYMSALSKKNAPVSMKTGPVCRKKTNLFGAKNNTCLQKKQHMFDIISDLVHHGWPKKVMICTYKFPPCISCNFDIISNFTTIRSWFAQIALNLMKISFMTQLSTGSNERILKHDVPCD